MWVREREREGGERNNERVQGSHRVRERESAKDDWRNVFMRK